MVSLKVRAAMVVSLTLAAWVAEAADVVTKTDDIGHVGTPISLVYGQAFNGRTGANGQAFDAGDTFHDRYSFDIDASLFSSVTSTVDLTIQGVELFRIASLDVNLYRYIDPTLPITGSSPTSLTNAQVVANGIHATSTGNSTETLVALALPPGRYLLDVSGQVAGTAGGAYSGVLNFGSVASVPEPAGLLLVGPGLLLMLSSRRGTVKAAGKTLHRQPA